MYCSKSSVYPPTVGGASGERIKGWVVSKITLARSGARNKSMSSVVMRVVLPMMLGVLAGDVKALYGSSGRMMLLHAVQRARKFGKGRDWIMLKVAGNIGMHR